MVPLACRHNLHVGSISGLRLDWKYAKLLCPVILLIRVLSMCVPILSMYFDLFCWVSHIIVLCVCTGVQLPICVSI